jgi:hypothetical protein
MDRFFIYGKPKITDVKPYKFVVNNPLLTSIQNFNILVKGNSFIDIRGVYLISNSPTMFEGTTIWNPFSGVKNLSADNPPFQGIKVPFYIYKEKYLAFTMPQNPNGDGFFDIIIENEAGYGKLSRDSRVPFVSSFVGAVDIQLPCVSGIQVIDPLDFMLEFILTTSDNKFILTSDTNQQITVSYLV